MGTQTGILICFSSDPKSGSLGKFHSYSKPHLDLHCSSGRSFLNFITNQGNSWKCCYLSKPLSCFLGRQSLRMHGFVHAWTLFAATRRTLHIFVSPFSLILIFNMKPHQNQFICFQFCLSYEQKWFLWVPTHYSLQCLSLQWTVTWRQLCVNACFGSSSLTFSCPVSMHNLPRVERQASL